MKNEQGEYILVTAGPKVKTVTDEFGQDVEIGIVGSKVKLESDENG